MISPEDIHKKASSQYFKFIKAWYNNSPFFPLHIHANKQAKGDFMQLQKQINDLTNNSKSRKNYGYSVELKSVSTKKYGTQSLPSKIWFESQNDFLKYIGKEEEFSLLQQNIELITKELPQLKNWTLNNCKKIVKYQNVWKDLCSVCTYFIAHPVPNLYIRELAVETDTKFIENHKPILSELLELLIAEHINHSETIFEKRFNLNYAEPLVRFLILDDHIANEYFSGLKDISIPVKQFTSLHLPITQCIIIENKTTIYPFLTLPPLKNTIAIYGGGYNVATQKNINWLNDKKILYWGDIDAQGFEILSMVRNYYPQTQSILMDIKTLTDFEKYTVEGTKSNITTALNLTETEQQVYNKVKTQNIRLEQEKIKFALVTKHIQDK